MEARVRKTRLRQAISYAPLIAVKIFCVHNRKARKPAKLGAHDGEPSKDHEIRALPRTRGNGLRGGRASRMAACWMNEAHEWFAPDAEHWAHRSVTLQKNTPRILPRPPWPTTESKAPLPQAIRWLLI